MVEKITGIRIRILFGLKKSHEPEYEYYSVWKYRLNTITNILVFEYYSNNIRIPNYSLTSGLEQVLSTCPLSYFRGQMIFVLRSSSPVCKLGAEIGNKTGILDYSPPTTAINAIHTSRFFAMHVIIICPLYLQKKLK